MGDKQLCASSCSGLKLPSLIPGLSPSRLVRQPQSTADFAPKQAFGTTLVFKCDEAGYKPGILVTYTCGADGQFVTTDSCVALCSGQTLALVPGILSGTSTLIPEPGSTASLAPGQPQGSTLVFNCSQPGWYSPDGHGVTYTCDKYAEFTTTDTCEKYTCPALTITEGHVSYSHPPGALGERQEGSVASFVCNDSCCRKAGNTGTRVCRGGVWEGKEQYCAAACDGSRLKIQVHGLNLDPQRDTASTGYLAPHQKNGATLVFRCDQPGFIPGTLVTYTCSLHGEFVTADKCVPVTCNGLNVVSVPHRGSFLELSSSGRQQPLQAFGSRLEYACERGYGDKVAYTCAQSGAFETTDNCEVLTCPDIDINGARAIVYR